MRPLIQRVPLLFLTTALLLPALPAGSASSFERVRSHRIGPNDPAAVESGGVTADSPVRSLESAGWIFQRDDRKREIIAIQPGYEVAAAKGKITVKNFSSFYAYIYVTPLDGASPWYQVDYVGPGYKLIFKLVAKRSYGLAAEVPGAGGDWEWGPVTFRLKKKFTWSLYN